MNETVAAIVVTYNRKIRLTRCLDALLKQARPVDKIILVDNASTDGTLDALKERKYLDNPLIDYLRLPQNTGGAGGFHAGIERGYLAGYDWLWVMDDDVEPATSALEFLCQSTAMTSPRTVAVASTKVGKDGNVQYWHIGNFSKEHGPKPTPPHRRAHDEIKIDYSAFVGLAIRSSVVPVAGLPRRDFFIWNDDLEYCLRIGQYGDIFWVRKSIVVHNDDRVEGDHIRWLLWRPQLVPIEVYGKELCGFRNREYVLRKYGEGRVPMSLFRLLRRLTRVILLEDYKLFRLKWLVVFYIDSYRATFRATPPAPPD